MEEKILIKGLETNFKIIGEGKPYSQTPFETGRPAESGDRPLLILHGWGSNSERWQKVGELLAKNGIKVIIPDLPGFGKSQKPSRAWGLDDYCEFAGEFIKFLNLERFYLLGHSFGGALAVKFSLKFPEKIDRLFLVGAACIRKETLKKRFFYILSKIFPSFPFLRNFLYKFIIKSDYLSVEGIMRETYLKIIKEDLSEILSEIQVPTVIIWGKKDDITPLKDAYFINSKIKNSKGEILSQIKHNPHLESPEKLAGTIIKYL